MGNSVLDGRSTKAAPISKFYSSDAWIEGRAEDQLNHLAKKQGILKLAAFPDLHPGKYGPVGCAILADRIFPHLIGSDIGCGMSLFELDLPQRKFKLHKSVRRLHRLDAPSQTDYSDRLFENGLPNDLFSDALGTIGGGNHFCEVQKLDHAEAGLGLDATRLYLLVHSGSRGFGSSIVDALSPKALDGLSSSSTEGMTYLNLHNQAVKWALLNRVLIAERAAALLNVDMRLTVDAPHNLLEKINKGWLHRKGAAKTGQGLVPLAGTRATPSYLTQPNDQNADALHSMAHGSGRKFDRSSMHGRVRAKKSDIAEMTRNPYGGRIICEDRFALVEEAPKAYKSSQSILSDLDKFNVAKSVATFLPLITFKKTKGVS